MASSFLLARSVSVSSISLTTTTTTTTSVKSHCLFRRSIGVDYRLLSPRKAIVGRGLTQWAKLNALQSKNGLTILRRDGKFFSSSKTMAAKKREATRKGEAPSPLEKLAGLMEDNLRPAKFSFIEHPNEMAAALPSGVEAYTTAAPAVALGRSGVAGATIDDIRIREGIKSEGRFAGATTDDIGIREGFKSEGRFAGATTDDIGIREGFKSEGRFAGATIDDIRIREGIKSEGRFAGATTDDIGIREGFKSEEKSKEEKAWFKPISDKVVGYWLLGSAGLVFGIVVLGGLTRLTESGLSITEWKPVTGSIPPLNQAHWEEEFAKYKDSPEYRILNPHMTLEEFKFIYYMEWTHRLWGRFIGLSFVIPAAYFIARGRVSRKMATRLVGISGLIGFQGFIGWWMVKSGLKDDLFTTPGNSVPRVSQYRLTAHLCAAFTVYLAMLYNGLKILRAHRFVSNPVLAQIEFKALADPRLRPFRRTVLGLALLAFTTAMSGGLVAGLDAGLIYNDFPKMGTGYKPPNSELFNPFYARDRENHSDLWWRNLLENPSTVQFQHRCLAMTTFTSIVGFWLWARYGRIGSAENAVKIWELLNRKMRMGVNGALHLVLFQVTLGISTLIYMVPTPLAAAHQAGSLALLTGIVVLGVRVSPAPQRTLGIVAKRMRELMTMGPGAAAAVVGLRGAGLDSLGNLGSRAHVGDVTGIESLVAARERIQKETLKLQEVFSHIPQPAVFRPVEMEVQSQEIPKIERGIEHKIINKGKNSNSKEDTGKQLFQKRIYEAQEVSTSETSKQTMKQTSKQTLKQTSKQTPKQTPKQVKQPPPTISTFYSSSRSNKESPAKDTETETSTSTTTSSGLRIRRC